MGRDSMETGSWIERAFVTDKEAGREDRRHWQGGHRSTWISATDFQLLQGCSINMH